MKAKEVQEPNVGEESTASSARPGTPSLKTTIPPGVRNVLKIESGDKLDWQIEYHEGRPSVRLTKK